MHADAGVREQVFVRKMLSTVGRRREVARRAESQPSGPDTIWVIVNGKIGVAAECVDDCLLPIAQRSVALLLDEGLVGSIFRIWYFAWFNGMLFQVTHVPSDVETEADSHAFNPASMRRLFERGLQMGQDPASWKSDPPTTTDSERAFMRRNLSR